jgi:PAS domain S-box-containing protein
MERPRILIVEDEQRIARVLKATLEHRGYQVVGSAATGEDAVEMAAELRPDLALMDIVLSGRMDGIEAAAVIRSSYAIPVVYLTAHAAPDLLERAKVTEPFGYVLKPFRSDELLAAVQMALYNHQVERRLKESFETYRQLAHLLPQIVFEIDVVGNLLFLNSAGFAALGLDAGDIESGLNLFQTVAADSTETVSVYVAKALHGQTTGGLEYTCLRKDRSTFPAVMYCSPVARDERIVGARCVSVDITERKASEEKLRKAHDELEIRVSARTSELLLANQRLTEEIAVREKAEEDALRSEQLFRSIFDSARDWIFVKDRSLRYTLVNPCMARLIEPLGMDPAQITDEALFGPQAANQIREVDDKVLGGEVVEWEQKRNVRGWPGTFLDIRVPLRDLNGEVTGICGISRDVTDRKRVAQDVPIPAPEYPSAAMRSTLGQALQAARTDTLILLTGESGAGKDYIARHIHENSKRAAGPFYVVNCAALAEELAESELFGHEGGAFTGARSSKRGLLELAEGGTLLLNEIGDLSLRLQAKLLTFLDSRHFTRVGGERTVKVNARLIAATNADLEDSVKKGRFRADLFYRLNVMRIEVPPLRQRIEDIPIIVNQLMAALVRELQLSCVPKIAPKDLDRLSSYSWPGNARELRNVLERALIVSRGDTLSLPLLGHVEPNHVGWGIKVEFPSGKTLDDVLAEVKRSLFDEALRRARGQKQEAARLLGISRFSLTRRMKNLSNGE